MRLYACPTCWALTTSQDWPRHEDWHIQRGDVETREMTGFDLFLQEREEQ